MQDLPTHSRPGARRGLKVLVSLLFFVGMFVLMRYIVDRLPSPQKACTQKCQASGKQGHLVSTGTPTTKEFYEKAGSVCVCQ